MSKIYKINNHLMKYNDSCINYKDPYNPLDLPPNTIRVKFKSGYTPSSSKWDELTLVDSTNNVWDIYKQSNDWFAILKDCSDLLEVLGANTSNIENMESMFHYCTSLTSVPLFDTSNVYTMCSMFQYCSALTSVPLFNTSNVENMNSMFFNCPLLTTVPLFNTSNVNNMGYMFYTCYSLVSVPLFNTSNVETFFMMFHTCQALESVPLLNTNKATNMDYTFCNCTNVQSGALALYQQASSQTTPPESHEYTFYKCGSDTQTGAAELAQIPNDWK